MIRRILAAPLALLCSLAPVAPADAASKVAIAALGDAAPGGGVFAGPSFVDEPSAAGSGWLAFRALVTAGSTTEQIVVTNVAARTRRPVASVGQTISPEIGSIRQFLGRPTVNARGEVAFAAEIRLPDDAPSDPFAPTPGGVFLWSEDRISVVVAPGFDTGFGILDLTAPLNVLTAESGADVAERTPALNDHGDVAFVAATFGRGGGGGAIFLRRAGQELTPVLKLGDPYGVGTFQVLGPPALNNAGTMAFHALVDGDPFLDGVFKLEGGTLSLLIRDGDTPLVLDAPFTIDPLFEFGDVVALNDAGDVACTGGPIFDNSDDANLADLEDKPGVILIQNGSPLLVGFPGQQGGLLDGVVTDLTLGPEEGSRVAAPSLTADGQVIFLAQLNNGSSQAILRFDPATQVVRPLVRLGGADPHPSPAGGTFRAASSAPALDADRNIAFSALIENASTSEALVWIPPAGPVAGEAISIGDAVPEPASGYFGGPAFFPPLLNDAGDVVFRSYVARGPGLGIFRAREGQLDAIVRVRDVAPASGGERFSNLVGEPSLNARGDVAFAATLAGRQGRGIFVASEGGLRRVAVAGDDLVPADPARPEAFLRTITANPSISDSGAVVFRGAVQYEGRFPFELFGDVRRNCIFLADDTGVHVIAAEGQDSGAGLPFLSFRDPTISGRSVLFRAGLGEVVEEAVGLFLADQAGVRPVAVVGQDLGGMFLEALQGKAFVGAAGEIYFSAQVRFAGSSDGAIVRSGVAGFEAVVLTGTAGPEGGRIRSLGRPSVSSNGRLALRLGFEPFRGGVPGLFLSRNDELRPFLRIGENAAAGINGRITSLQNVALNASDQAAFLATVGGNGPRSAIFVASPATLRVSQLLMKRGPATIDPDAAPRPRDRLKLAMAIEPGGLPPATSFGGEESEPQRMRPKPVTVTVADTVGALWTGTLPAADTELRGDTLRKKGGAAETRIANLRVRFAADGRMRIKVSSLPFDLSTTALGFRRDENGAIVLEPPLSVRVDVGEDGASVVLPCRAKGRRFSCRSRRARAARSR